MPLLSFSKQDAFTLGDALTGVCILGGTGSGKTSASGYQLRKAYLEAGMGGLVLCAKGDEPALWARECERAGRASDLIVFSPDRSLRFNFLQDELAAAGGHAGGIAFNIVALLLAVLEIASRIGSGGTSPEGRGESDPYWQNAARQLILNAVDLLLMARGNVTMADLHRAISSAPQSREESRDPAWQRESFCYRCIAEADVLPMSHERRDDFELVAGYFLREFAALSPKTRGVIVSCVGAMTDPLLRGLCRTLFCTDSNVSPALTAQGKVIVVALPVKEYREVGLITNAIWKVAFQRWAERRDLRASNRPVFLWADEAPIFVSGQDAGFQATCRSSRVATVMLSQTIGSFHAALGGGDKGRVESDVLLGNLMTKILHASNDPVTNQWASSLIGNRLTFLMNGGSSRPESACDDVLGLRSSGQASAGFSETMMPEVQPGEFLSLRTGGPSNCWLADTIIVRSGPPFASTGRHWMRCAFPQAEGEKG